MIEQPLQVVVFLRWERNVNIQNAFLRYVSMNLSTENLTAEIEKLFIIQSINHNYK